MREYKLISVIGGNGFLGKYIVNILLDKGYLTDVRTAIAGSIAAKYLSNLESTKAGIIGAGLQARLQLEALKLVRPIDTAFVWSRNSKKLEKFIKEIDYLDLKIEICQSPEELLNKSDIVITTTPSKLPLIKSDWLKKGLHITAMGSDAEDISLTVHPHPTVGETIGLASEVFDGTITDLYIPKKK